jgi:hypothetical protein
MKISKNHQRGDAVTKGYLTGMTGVYYVAAESSRRGYVVAITSRNAPGVDVLAIKGSRRVDIQVKTNGEVGSHSFWLLSRQARKWSYPGLYYVFVNLRPGRERPDFYVARSSEVCDNMDVDRRKTGSVWYSFARSDNYLEKWAKLD